MIDRRISVVLAHPDDESFGMGGTLAKYAAQGVVIHVILATRGEASIPGADPGTAGDIREVEAREACRILGVQRLDFLGFGDGQLAAVPDDVAVGRLVGMLQRDKPDIVVTFGPDGVSGHSDHVTVSRWTTLAFDHLGESSDCPRKLYYLAPSEATQQACGEAPSAEVVGEPVASIDIDAFKTHKVLAMQAHQSQHPPLPGPPADEATKLACHEVFRRARPKLNGGETGEDDLFYGLAPAEGA